MATLGWNPSSTPGATAGLGYYLLGFKRVQASEDGDATAMSVYANWNGTQKVVLGLYADSASAPGAKLGQTGEITPPSGAGWASGSLAASVEISSGTYYWLAAHTDLDGTTEWGEAAGSDTLNYRSVAYSATMPDPFGSPLTIGSYDWAIYLTYTPAVSDTITVTSPVQYQTFQRSGSDQASIAISGTYTGTPTAIEASFNGGAYATSDASPTGGTFSGTLSNQAAGQGTLTVRFTNATSVAHTVASVGIGDVFLVIGDSIAEGRGTNAQSDAHATLQATCFRQDDAWALGDDPVDTGTSSGSHWPLLARWIEEDQSVPVAFVTCGTGSTDVAGTHNEWAKNNSSYQELIAQKTAVGGTFKAVLAHLGPNAVASDLTQATYNAALDQLASDIGADVQASLPLCVGVFGECTTVSGTIDTLRAAVIEAWGDNSAIKPGPVLIDQDYSDGVHPQSDSALQAVAARWWAALNEGLYSGPSGRGPRLSTSGYSGTTITLVFDADLATATTYTSAAFVVTDGSGTRTVSSVTKTGTRTVQIAVSGGALTDTVTVKFASDNTAAGATVPTRSYTMPDSSTIALPAEPFSTTVTLCQIGGTVTLSGIGVDGLTVYVIDTTAGTLGTATTDVNGDYACAATPGHVYLVIPNGHENGGTKYNALSKPYIEP